MGRSGTTWMTRALSGRDVFLGVINDRFENIEVRKINDAIFSKYFHVKRGILPYGNPKDIESIKRSMISGDYVDSINNVFKNHIFSALDNKYWIFKDPKTILLSGLWLSKVDICVGLIRRPWEVCESYVFHKFISGSRPASIVEDYWLIFNKILFEFVTSGQKETYIVDFNGDVESQFKKVVFKLGLERKQSRYEINQKHINKEVSSSVRKESIILYDKLKEMVIK